MANRNELLLKGYGLAPKILLPFLLLLIAAACSGDPSTPGGQNSLAVTAIDKVMESPSAEYSPDFEVKSIGYDGTVVQLVVCFDLPSSDKDWVLGRLPGDVSLGDGTNEVVMPSFSFVSLDSGNGSAASRRCDEFVVSTPAQLEVESIFLRVERIAASVPPEVDWDLVRGRLQQTAAGLEIEPMPGEGGPSFGLTHVPPGMSDLEAHNLVVGVIDPVILGPWIVPFEITD